MGRVWTVVLAIGVAAGGWAIARAYAPWPGDDDVPINAEQAREHALVAANVVVSLNIVRHDWCRLARSRGDRGGDQGLAAHRAPCVMSPRP